MKILIEPEVQMLKVTHLRLLARKRTSTSRGNDFVAEIAQEHAPN